MKRHNFWKIRGGAGTALAVALLLLSFTAAWASDVLVGVRTEIVSLNSLGQPANGGSDNVKYYSTRYANVSQHPYPKESAGNINLLDGRIVAYTSKVGNLYPLGGDSKWNVYINDLGGQINMGAAYLVSQTGSGNQGDGDSAFARVDPSGQFVVFQSSAEDFLNFSGSQGGYSLIFDTGNNPGKSDIFIASLGTENSATPTVPSNLSISNYELNTSEVFYEYANDDSGFLDGGTYDQRAFSANFEWPFAIYRTYAGNDAGIGPAVIFQSRATNFETGGVNALTTGRSHLYAMQLYYSFGNNTLSLAATGFDPSQPALLTKGYDCGAEAHYSCEANGESSGPAVSSGGRRYDDGGVIKGDFNLTEDGYPVAGRYVVFTSTATNLVPGLDASDYPDDPLNPGKKLPSVFLLDRDPEGNGNLIGLPDAQEFNLNMIDFDPSQTYFTLISHAYGDPTRAGNGASSFPSISADGKRIAYQSKASDLIAPGLDTNGKQDIFVVDLNTGITERVSISSAGEQNDKDSFRPAMSGDGALIAFETTGRLAADDTNDAAEFNSNGNDIYIRKPSISLTWRVSLTADGRQGVDYQLQQYSALSWTGQYVYWSSSATLQSDGASHQDVQVFYRDQANPPNNPDVSPTSMMLGYVPYDETRSKTFVVTVQSAIKIRFIDVQGDERFDLVSTTCPTGDVEVAPVSELEPYKCEITVSFYSDGLGGKQTGKLLIGVDDRPYESNPAEYNRELQMYLEADGATVLYLPLMSGPSDPQP